MFNTILIRYDEIGTKMKNRYMFEDRLASNIQGAIGKTGKVFKFRGRIAINVAEWAEIEEINSALRFVPGIASFSPCIKLPLDAPWEEIEKVAVEFGGIALKNNKKIFRVKCNRAFKKYPSTSVELAKKLSVTVLKAYDKMFTVAMKDAEFVLEIEIDVDGVYIFMERIEGISGLPVGTVGDVLCLLSGGIDSPVAAYLTMRRGAAIHYMSFHTPPYTGEESMQKLLDLTALLKKYQGISTKMYIVPFLDIQLLIRARCQDPYRTILFRRMMNRFAERVALENKYKAIVTGESLAQVASQTIENMTCIGESVKTMPIIRPVITNDKNETIIVARKIGTFDISIRSCADSCTAFIPERPVTKGRLDIVLREEENLKPEIDALFEEAYSKIKVIEV